MTKIMRQNPKRLAVILAATFPCLGIAAETALTLDSVVVSGSRVEHNTFDLPAAVDVVDAARIGADQARVCNVRRNAGGRLLFRDELRQPLR